MTKNLVCAMLSGLLVLLASPAFSQDKSASTDTSMQILRAKVKADKKLLIAVNMDLTDAEAATFWPVYDAYQKDLQAITIAIDEAEAKARRDTATRLQAILPGKKVARYLQIESKIRAGVRYELAANVPLVE